MVAPVTSIKSATTVIAAVVLTVVALAAIGSFVSLATRTLL